MKSILCLAASTMLLFMTACGAGNNGLSGSVSSGSVPVENASSQQQSADKTNARIGFITQEYQGDNIVEIPYIQYEGDQVPDIEAINRSLNQGIKQVYESFMGSREEPQWIEIRSYPFTSPDYLQVVVTSCTYPIYGTDGELFSINFDKKENKWISVSDIMAILSMDQDMLLSNIKVLFKPESSSQSIGGVTATGFLIQDNPEGQTVKLLLEITIDNTEAETWKYFYAYTPDLNELVRLNSSCLFDPSEMEKMDPPLAYQRGLTC